MLVPPGAHARGSPRNMLARAGWLVTEKEWLACGDPAVMWDTSPQAKCPEETVIRLCLLPSDRTHDNRPSYSPSASRLPNDLRMA